MNWGRSGERLVGGFLLLYVAGYLLLYSARRLILRRKPWWTDAGCPECGTLELVDAHEERLKRFMGRLIALPLGRHACRYCGWEGLRPIGGRAGWRTADAPVTTTPVRSPIRQPVNLTDLSSGAIEAPPSKQPHQATTPGQDLAVAVGRRREFSLHDGLQIETFVDYAQRPLPVALFYLAALTLAEVTSVLFLPTVGATLHILILFVLLLHAAFTWDKAIHRFLLVLTLVPLIRVISLSLPLADFSLSYWFLITSVPLFAAAYVIMRQLDFSWRDLGLGWRSLPLQLLIGSTGVLFGMAEYYILKPDPLVENLSWQQVWLPAAVLLLSTGFLEEYIFRFLMQRTSVERLGHKLGIVYVALFFAVLHIGYRSVVDFLFVLVVGLFFGIVAWRTRSIVGVTISHGLTNIMLFLIVPYT